MTAHNKAKINEIAKTVLMPGDPLRAKYIAEKYLTNVKLVNDVRNIYAYTGFYNDKEVTIMASGMGMPSIGIYSYELYKFYNVENIIRIGSCGCYTPTLDLLDIVLVENSYNEGNFAYNFDEQECHFIESSKELNMAIESTAKKINQKYVKCNMASTEVFDPYLKDPLMYARRLPKEYNILGSEMEAFALFYIAKRLNKKAACLLTVSDSNFKKENLTADERQNALNNMIELALKTVEKL